MESNKSNMYKTKTIEFQGKRNILIQNENGPCALLAIVNSLLLTVTADSAPQVHELVALVNSESEIELNQLLNRLGDIAVANQATYGLDPSEVQATLSLLPKLHEGLNINPMFDGSFVEGQELSIFKVFQLPLAHGWIVDPEDIEHAALRKYNSYEASQNVLVEAYEVEKKAQKDYADEEILADSKQIKHFFARSATQLTDYGLNYLKQNLDENSVAVFFRNDHFGTIIKKDNDIYELVTDIGFKDKSQFVWESLLSINGANNSFFTGAFTPLLEDSSNPFDDGTTGSPHEFDDRALALQIQEEEDARVAKALQKRYEPKPKSLESASSSKKQKKKSKEKKDEEGRDKKDKKCVIM